MQPRSTDVEAVDPSVLRDKALNLRESVNSSRARMNAQRERLERLRADIAQMRALAERPLPVRTPLRSMPVLEEIVSDSAPETVSSRTGRGAWKNIPYALIFLIAVGLQIRRTPGRTPGVSSSMPPVAAAAPLPPTPASPEVLAEDDGADEALLLAHDWHMPGDDLPLSQRLGSDDNPPGTLPEWTAERTGESTYRVSFRRDRSDSGYDFDVDLPARRVDPTPETAELIAPRLASRR